MVTKTEFDARPTLLAQKISLVKVISGTIHAEFRHSWLRSHRIASCRLISSVKCVNTFDLSV